MNNAMAPSPGQVQAPQQPIANPYANLLASYQQAAQNNYGQQIANANRDQQAYQGELLRQQKMLQKQNSFWNRIKGGFTNGLVNLAQQAPSMALKAGMAAAGGPIGGLMAGESGDPLADQGSASMPSSGPTTSWGAAGGANGGLDMGAGVTTPASRVLGYGGMYG